MGEPPASQTCTALRGADLPSALLHGPLCVCPVTVRVTEDLARPTKTPSESEIAQPAMKLILY